MSEPSPAASARERRRLPPGKVRASLLRNMPQSLRWGLPLFLLVLAVRWLLLLQPAAVGVEAVGFQGAAFAAGGLTADLYPYDATGAGDYPPPRLQQLQFDGDGRASLPVAALGAAAEGLLVARTPANGIAWAHIDPARSSAQLEFGVPQRLAGRIRGAGGEAVPGANVQVLSDRYGVVLAEAACDAAGAFAVDGLSSSNTFFTLRARAPGHALQTEDVQLVPDLPVEVRLAPTRPVTGTVELPPGVAAAGLRLRAFRVPGAGAELCADGSFAIDHLPPPPTRVRLLVAGLPDGLTHAAAPVAAGAEGIAIRVARAARIRGHVVLAHNDAPVAGAYVEHPHGPRGKAVAYTDAAGRFELELAPPGLVRIEAFVSRTSPRRPGPADEASQLAGFAEVEVEEGVDASGVVVRVF